MWPRKTTPAPQTPTPPPSTKTTQSTSPTPTYSSNVHDIDGGLHITSVGNATHGTVVRTNGVTTYTPDPDYNGDDASFEYTATDLHGGTTTGVVNITVNPTDDPGTADPDTATVDEDDSIDITDADLLTNVHDIDGGLHITSVGNATHGTVAAPTASPPTRPTPTTTATTPASNTPPPTYTAAPPPASSTSPSTPPTIPAPPTPSPRPSTKTPTPTSPTPPF